MLIPTLATLSSSPAIAQIGRGGGGRGPGFIFPFLFLLLIGGLAMWLINRRRSGSIGSTASGQAGPAAAGPGSAGLGSAMEVLQQRFARGDIDQAEYEHRKAVLLGAQYVPPRTTEAATQATASTEAPDQAPASADDGVDRTAEMNPDE